MAGDDSALMRELRGALGANKVRFELTFGFGTSGPRDGVIVQHKGYADRSWRKVSAAIYTADGQTLGELLTTLVELRGEAQRARE